MSEANIQILPPKQRIKTTDRIILFGDGGTGKSYSLHSLFKNAPEERRVIYLMTEPNAMAGLERGLEENDITIEHGQLVYSFPRKTGKAKGFQNYKRAVNKLTKESKNIALKGNSDTTMGKENYTYFQDIIDKLDDFEGIDYATGEATRIPGVDTLDHDDILVIDGLSPIIHEIWHSSVGDKLAISEYDYGIPQNILEGMLRVLESLTCHIILLAHEKPVYNKQGTLEKTVVNFGVGNAKDSIFKGCMTDIIYCYTMGSKFLWAGNKSNVDCVARKIPRESALTPDFSLYNFFGNQGSYVEK